MHLLKLSLEWRLEKVKTMLSVWFKYFKNFDAENRGAVKQIQEELEQKHQEHVADKEKENRNVENTS
jgi:superoxide dismutase